MNKKEYLLTVLIEDYSTPEGKLVYKRTENVKDDTLWGVLNALAADADKSINDKGTPRGV